MKVEAKILSGKKNDLEKELNQFLNLGFKIKGGLILDCSNNYHLLITKKTI